VDSWSMFIMRCKFRKTVGIPPNVNNGVEYRNLC
jgi:hypothetical protein